MLRPLLLRPDNFTAAARTPWGGYKIAARYKATAGLPASLRGARVGEAWELSFGPELPSVTLEGVTLREVARQDTRGYLGAEAPFGASALLVKWLDAATNLSVQIHPSDDDEALAADEAGKPECWYVVERDPGAGLYLGLRDGVTERSMRAALEQRADVSQLLRFVPVEPGDFFVIAPGLPHAVGGGVLLLEPQLVAPGRRGVTLRYWDWNRLYDARGQEDPRGAPRPLQVDHALAVTRFAEASDAAWLATQRCRAPVPSLAAEPLWLALCGTAPRAGVPSPYLRVARASGTGPLELPAADTLGALTVIEGAITLQGAWGALRVGGGQTAALPAGLGASVARLDHAHALLSRAVPRPERLTIAAQH